MAKKKNRAASSGWAAAQAEPAADAAESETKSAFKMKKYVVPKVASTSTNDEEP